MIFKYIFLILFILCRDINNTNFDETLLLDILSKFKLTSLGVYVGDKDEDIFMSLLQMPSIQETLEHFEIDNLDIFKCTFVIELLVEFKRIKSVRINWLHSLNDDELDEWKVKIEHFEEILKKKHSDIEINIY